MFYISFPPWSSWWSNHAHRLLHHGWRPRKLSTGTFYNDFARVALSMSHVWRRYMPRSKMSHLLEVQKKEFSTLYFQVKQSDANGKIASYLQLTCTRKYILKKCISHIYQNKYILNKTIYIYICISKKYIYIYISISKAGCIRARHCKTFHGIVL